MEIGLKEACSLLKKYEKIWVITHRSPDGDALGCSFALYHALKALGKQARVLCSDPFPARYDFLYEGYVEEDFEADFLVTVDLAAEQLFGQKLQPLAEQVNLCIDHHPSNTCFAKHTFVEIRAAAAEIIHDVILELGVEITLPMATGIYTGIATDTGCFRFSNTTADSHRIAGKMMEAGAPYAQINQRMFETKSPRRIAVEREVYNTVEYAFGGRCALVRIPLKLLEETGADEYEIEGIAGLPRQIEGVEVGVTIYEKPGGVNRVSLRTADTIDACEIAGAFGGGGHARAAGCSLDGTMEEVKNRLLERVGQVLQTAVSLG